MRDVMAAKKKKNEAKKAGVQKELVIVMVLSLILGVGGGYAIGAATTDGDSSTTSKKEGQSHSHSMFMVSEDEAPKVELVVSEDKKSGYNVKVITTDFTFTPGDVNGENVVGEGHAHLYVDGEKVARIYGPYYHYDGNFEGTKTFRVTLNSNDHGEYAVDGEVIESSVEVTHDSNAEGHDEMHMHDGMDKDESHMHSDDEDHMHSDM